ncbi:MerR family transcriptional regulator [Isoptericola halotolerans]|uniref:DNA-binding transcriptional MerR regulator n=1 Tax=Isoptericola halotolerans TaxID=300560 RepID=A0ABX2A3A9_9MICO|nr:MerR family transcriptional regulator [Isoptericola halotolerans]NOV97134.1 DNA-binding transcriptional MerR regulator [Isoptericola halotolerans]
MNGRRRTSDVARATGYSVQQVRDLERLGVIPPASRSSNGYRRYRPLHLQAVRAYRGLATAVGPVIARRTMVELWRSPRDVAVASLTELHVGLAEDRRQTLQALDALYEIGAEPAATRAGDVLSITELADALGVRTSTLRHWESEGLVTAQRVGSLRVRTYDVGQVGAARIVAALRAAGYGVPEVATVMAALRGAGGTAQAETALRERLDTIATRSLALLRAGTDLVAVVDSVELERSRTTRATRPSAPG